MKVCIRRMFFMLLLSGLLSVEALAARMVVPVGQVIGIELLDGSVTVAAVDETLGAEEAIEIVRKAIEQYNQLFVKEK